MKTKERTCKINSCKNPSFRKGWCCMHYSRYLRTGNPLLTKRDLKEFTSKEELENLYLNKKLSTTEIGEIFNVSDECIREKMIKFRIPRRNYSKSVEIARKRKKWGAWNKGLTRETDERVKKYSISAGKTRSKLMKKGKWGQWLKDTRLGWNDFNGKEWFDKKRMEGMQMKPNKPETIMIEIIKENNLPFNYVGDGQVIIGGFNPDFLSKNPKHIIEVFGDYWHKRPEVLKRDKRKLKTYSKYGYKTLIIWEHELVSNQYGNQLSKQIIINRIKEFMR